MHDFAWRAPPPPAPSPAPAPRDGGRCGGGVYGPSAGAHGGGGGGGAVALFTPPLRVQRSRQGYIILSIIPYYPVNILSVWLFSLYDSTG